MAFELAVEGKRYIEVRSLRPKIRGQTKIVPLHNYSAIM